MAQGSHGRMAAYHNTEWLTTGATNHNPKWYVKMHIQCAPRVNAFGMDLELQEVASTVLT